MKVSILNDTSEKGHIGSMLCMSSLRRQCAKSGMNVLHSIPTYITDLKPHYEKFAECDLLIVNGEGSTHSNNRNELFRIASEFPSVLINAVFQNNALVPGLREFHYVAVRESYSAEELKKVGIDAEIVPDLCFASPHLVAATLPKQLPSRTGVTDSVFCKKEHDIIFHNERDFSAIVSQFSKFSRVCSGRFHGIVFAAMLGIPFSAYRSNTWKNEALLHDMGIGPLFSHRMEDALELTPRSTPESVQKYVQEAPARISRMFGTLEEIR